MVMKTAVNTEDYKLWNEGKRPRKKVKPSRPEPKAPKVDNSIKLDKIKTNELVSVTKGRRHVIRNEDGVMFMGYDVGYQIEGQKAVEGWMSEADYVKLRRLLFREGTINVDALEY